MQYKAIVEQIKRAGQGNAQIVQSAQDPQKFDIQIKEGSQWKTILSNVSKPIAEDTLRQATSRMLLG